MAEPEYRIYGDCEPIKAQDVFSQIDYRYRYIVEWFRKQPSALFSCQRHTSTRPGHMRLDKSNQPNHVRHDAMMVTHRARNGRQCTVVTPRLEQDRKPTTCLQRCIAHQVSPEPVDLLMILINESAKSYDGSPTRFDSNCQQTQFES